MPRVLLFLPLAAFFLSLSFAQPAVADGERREKGERKQRRITVPEFSPAAAGTIAALVAGGALLAVRRRQKKD